MRKNRESGKRGEKLVNVGKSGESGEKWGKVGKNWKKY